MPHYVWIGGVVLAALVVYLAWLGSAANTADWGSKILNVLDGLNRMFCRHYHRLQFEPIPLPARGGAIVAANHLSGLDPLLLSAASDRPLRFVIATEEYERPILRWFYDSIGTIPVDRVGAPEKAFYRARQSLQQGEVVVIFPQGGIRVPSAPRKPLKRGIAVLAVLADVPVVPVRVSGVGGIGRIVSALFIRSNARIASGSSIGVTGGRDTEALATIEEFITRGVYDDYTEVFKDATAGGD